MVADRLVISFVGCSWAEALVQQSVLRKLCLRPRAQFPYGFLYPKSSGDSGPFLSVKWWFLKRLRSSMNRSVHCRQYLSEWCDAQVAMSTPVVEQHTGLLLLVLVKCLSQFGYGGAKFYIDFFSFFYFIRYSSQYTNK